MPHKYPIIVSSVPCNNIEVLYSTVSVFIFNGHVKIYPLILYRGLGSVLIVIIKKISQYILLNVLNTESFDDWLKNTNQDVILNWYVILFFIVTKNNIPSNISYEQ